MLPAEVDLWQRAMQLNTHACVGGWLYGQQGFRPPVDTEPNRAPMPHRPYVIRPTRPDIYGLPGAGAYITPYIVYYNEQPVVENPAYHMGSLEIPMITECNVCRCENVCCMPRDLYDYRAYQRYARSGYLDYPMVARSDVAPPVYYGYGVADDPYAYGWAYPQNGHVSVAVNGLNDAPYANSAAGGCMLQDHLPYHPPSDPLTVNAPECVYLNTPLTNGFQPPTANDGAPYHGFPYLP